MKLQKLVVPMAVALFAGGLVFAGHGPGCRGKKGFGPERIAKMLDLNDQQIEQWKAKHEAMHDSMKPLREKMKDLHQQLKKELQAETPDAQKVGELTIALKNQKTKIHDAHEKLKADLETILTPKQQEKFELIHEMHEQAGDKKGCRGFGRGFGHGGGHGEGHVGHHGHDADI